MCSDYNAMGTLEYPEICIDPQSFSKLCSAFWPAKLGWEINAVLLKIHGGNVCIVMKKSLNFGPHNNNIVIYVTLLCLFLL